ncbi:ROK family protein [Parendozoicomonas haliclonae]|uniref:N-acetylglucosamine kinase n=1 Tax=Parendozoicomonas haliclonae TaxID=1960125 RepID=A0A1X7AP75_9GAMM|nr:ROK family protein [Parendozoicomonas haliclonae]SMA49908.1 N-acetyl-D-glucosamine kinase [Parendozoicomonas haliclonae]
MHYGLDIGGTKIEIAAFDAEFQRQDSLRVPTPKTDYKEFLETVGELITRFDQQYGVSGTVGLGIPGVENQSTGQLTISNVPAIHGQRLRDDLARVIRRPVALENDARCFVFSEVWGGSADRFNNVFGVILGTGAGGGLCLQRKIYQGVSNLAGEWGHTALPASLQQKYQLPVVDCGCGLSGCYERYISGPGIASLHRHFTGKTLSTPDIIENMRAGEPEAVKTFDCFIDIAGAAMASLVLTVNPEAFVMGGGVSNISEIYDRLPVAIGNHLFGNNQAPAVLAPMFGDSGGVRGAAILGSQLS